MGGWGWGVGGVGTRSKDQKEWAQYRTWGGKRRFNSMKGKVSEGQRHIPSLRYGVCLAQQFNYIL